MKSVDEQLALIKRGADEILVESELRAKLERGKHVLRVRYLGSTSTEASKARKVVVRVRR